MESTKDMETDKHIKVLFKHNAFDSVSYEGAWVKLEGNSYILDNILFYAKNYSWGDVVSIKEEKGESYAIDLIKESGHSTIRILFSNINIIADVREELEKKGCDSEISNFDRLISVDIPPSVPYSAIIQYLEKGEEKGKWEYEEACVSSTHKDT